jgi:hypothetical protein
MISDNAACPHAMEIPVFYHVSFLGKTGDFLERAGLHFRFPQLEKGRL